VTLEQLRVFVAVAERQHVTRAAAVLNLAQSAVSAAIAALEARHGAKLFHRAGRGVELTEAGALFLVEARAILARVEAAGQVLSELGNLKRGTLAVHASQTITGCRVTWFRSATNIPASTSASPSVTRLRAPPRCMRALQISLSSRE
jgi:DNA-binding transcriptional LysR family regulator